MRTNAMIIDYEKRNSTKEEGKVNYFVSLLIGNSVLKLFANEKMYQVCETLGKRNDAQVELGFYECARDNFGNAMYKFNLVSIEKIK